MDRCTCTPAQCEACPSKVICRCLQVTEVEVVTAIVTLGLRTIKEVRQHTGAGDGCTCCHGRLRKYLGQHSSPVPAIAG